MLFILFQIKPTFLIIKPIAPDRRLFGIRRIDKIRKFVDNKSGHNRKKHIIMRNIRNFII